MTFEGADARAALAIAAGWLEWRADMLNDLQATGLSRAEARRQLDSDCPPELQKAVVDKAVAQLRRVLLDNRAPTALQ